MLKRCATRMTFGVDKERRNFGRRMKQVIVNEHRKFKQPIILFIVYETIKILL